LVKNKNCSQKFLVGKIFVENKFLVKKKSPKIKIVAKNKNFG